MCGIIGFYGEDKHLIRQMTAIISHRGPDQEGFYVDDKVSLGFRRLAIIDLSEKGSQPMKSKDGNVVLIFNGEIYNYKELREELAQRKGFRFESQSDTEVILHGYEAWGDGVFSRLSGIFAIAILDGKARKLVIARDQIGVKPLYFYHDHAAKTFMFGSEIKGMLLHPDVPRKVNRRSLNAFLSFRYVPGRESMFQGIHRVRPGECLTLDLKSCAIRIERFWNLEEKMKNPALLATAPKDMASAAARLRQILDHVVERQLMSDVPLGVFLSGGLDSSAVAAIATQVRKAQHNSEPLKTFSIGFSDSPAKVNELRYAKMVADHLQTDHHEIVLEPSALREYAQVAWHLEEPLADATTIPTYYISKFSKRWVTVTLTGEGGDEAFGGYVQYKVLGQSQRFIRPIPKFVRHHLMAPIVGKVPIALLTKFFDYPSSIGTEGRERLKEFLKAQHDPALTYLTLISVFSSDEKRRLLNDPSNEMEGFEAQLVKEMRDASFSTRKLMLDQIFMRENETWLPDWILSRLDKTTMAHSQESRVPLLDVDLVEYAAIIPRELKRNKNVFRVAMRGSLPREIEQRRKFPFYLPIDSWFGKGYRELTKEVLDPKSMSSRQYFRQGYIDKLLGSQESAMLHSRQLWTLFSFEVWHKLFIEQEKVRRFDTIDALYGK